MSDSSQYTAGFDSYPMAYKPQSFDLLFPSTEALPSHPDVGEFESEIDSTLAGFEGTVHILDNDLSFFRTSLNPCGPLSAFTESAYGSSSSQSESAYNPPSPNSGSNYSYAGSTYSSAYEFDAMALDFQHVCVDEYTAQSTINVANDSVDPTSFGPLPPTPPRSPPAPISAAKPYPRTSFSDYGPPRRSSITSDLFPQITFNAASIGGHSTVSPVHISAQLPQVQQPMLSRPMVDIHKPDPRKKYRCPHCPRAFARAYNLKTHKATHDPNRLKPHVCPHRTCARSFSRKHDLGRHLVSIHRDDTPGAVTTATKKPIGVERGNRIWCDNCGKSWVGRSTPCDCHDVK